MEARRLRHVVVCPVLAKVGQRAGGDRSKGIIQRVATPQETRACMRLTSDSTDLTHSLACSHARHLSFLCPLVASSSAAHLAHHAQEYTKLQVSVLVGFGVTFRSERYTLPLQHQLALPEIFIVVLLWQGLCVVLAA